MRPGTDAGTVYLCREPVDFRKSISGLAVLVEQALGLDPFANALYVFTNRDRDRIATPVAMRSISRLESAERGITRK
jgi:transposase